MTSHLRHSVTSINPKSLARRKARQIKLLANLQATGVGSMLVDLLEEQTSYRELWTQLREQPEPDVEALATVTKSLELIRERIFDIAGMPKRPGQQVKHRKGEESKLLTLAQPAEVHTIEPSGPSSEPVPPL